jgi:hypothetical protein
VSDLLFRGTFGYRDWGHRDRTHLRWFTRRDLAEMLTGAGWQVTGASNPALVRAARLDGLTRGRSTDFLVEQIYALAERSS